LSIRLQADSDPKLAIVKAVRRREPSIDFASASDAGLEGVSDPELLELVARENRVLVSHDRRTMLNHFRNRLKAGKTSPGLLVASQGAPIGLVVDAIILLWVVVDSAELRDQIYHLPSLTHHQFPR
jgi:hypothetical protein